MPESLRTRNCETEVLIGDAEFEDSGEVVRAAPLLGSTGCEGTRSASIERSDIIRASIRFLCEAKYEPVGVRVAGAGGGAGEGLALVGPASSPSSVISSSRLDDPEGVAVRSGKDEAREVSLMPSAVLISSNASYGANFSNTSWKCTAVRASNTLEVPSGIYFINTFRRRYTTTPYTGDAASYFAIAARAS